MIRTNEKLCFPCDNSVIRIEKHLIGGRRHGSSLILKDNLMFGIKETLESVKDKVDFEDEIINIETRNVSDKRCELWLEFENGVRMAVEMQS